MIGTLVIEIVHDYFPICSISFGILQMQPYGKNIACYKIVYFHRIITFSFLSLLNVSAAHIRERKREERAVEIRNNIFYI